MSEGTLKLNDIRQARVNQEFVSAFRSLQSDAYNINAAHGFNEDDEFTTEPQRLARIGLKIALVHSELSEALEAIRKGNPHDDHIPQYSGAEAECADAIIRLMNLATSNNWNLAEAIVAKNEYNRNRPYRHGGKKF